MERPQELVIYPTRQRLDEAIKLLVETGGDTAYFTGHITTIGAFEEKLAGELLGFHKAISDLERSLLALKIVNQRFIGAKSLFANIIDFKGFVPALLTFFDELGAGLLGPKEFCKITRWSIDKELDVTALYSAYREELVKAGYVDRGVIRQQVIEALRKEEAYSSHTLLSYNHIKLVDVYQYTPYRFEMVRLIALRKRVTIVAPVPDERNKAFGFIVHNLRKFESLGDSEGFLEIEWREPAPSPLTALSGRLFSLHSSTKKRKELSGRVRIIKCASRYREIEEVGAAIAKLRKKKNWQWSDFCVVFRNITSYGPIIEDVFHRYEIPFFMKRGLTLTSNPLARALLSLFEAIDTSYQRDNIKRILGSPYFKRFDSIDIDEAQNLFLSAKIIDGPSTKYKALFDLAKKERKDKNRTSHSKIEKETLWLIGRLERIARSTSPRSFFVEIAKLTEDLQYSPAIMPDADPTIAFRDNSAFGLITHFISEASFVTSSSESAGWHSGYQKLRDTFCGHIKNMSLPDEGSANRNRVFILSAHDIVGINFNTVFIAGLHEREFPLKTDLRSILSEEERENFNVAHKKMFFKDNHTLANGRNIFDRASVKWQEESLLFYQAVAAAKDMAIFTYSAQNLSGSPLMRSQFIDDVLDVIAPGVTLEERDSLIEKPAALAIMKDDKSFLDPEEERAKLLRDIFRKETGTERHKSADIEKRIADITTTSQKWARFTRLLGLADTEQNRDSFFFEPEIKKKLALATFYDGFIPESGPLLNTILAVKRKGRYAPTDMEKYGACPFKYFASKPLSLGPVEEPVLEMDAMSSGSLAHDILEDFYDRLIKKSALPLVGTKEEQGLLEKSIENICGLYTKKGKTGDPAIFAVARKGLKHTLNRWLLFEIEDQRKNGFLPVAVEASFDLPGLARGNDGKPDGEPLCIPVSCGGDRYLTGIADRIDINKDKLSVRVIDYKTSADKNKYQAMTKKEAMGKTSFQLPLYMILAENFVQDKKLLESVTGRTAGYCLLKAKSDAKTKTSYILTDTGKKAEPVDDGVFLSYTKDKTSDEGTFLSSVASVIESIERGYFPIIPVSCNYCDFAGLCRFITTPFSDDTENE